MYVPRYSRGGTYLVCGHGDRSHFVGGGASDCLWLVRGTITDEEEIHDIR